MSNPTLVPCREQGQDNAIAVSCTKLASVGLAVILHLDFKGEEAKIYCGHKSCSYNRVQLLF